MATEQSKQALRQKRRENGDCIYCGKKADNGTRCSECTRKATVNRKRQAERKAKQGICKNIGCSNAVSNGHSYCDACNTSSAARTHARRQQRVKDGKCAYCDNVPLPGLTRCDGCNKRLLQSNANLDAKRVAAGKCGRCGDHVLEPGYRRCRACIDEARNRHRQLKRTVLEAYGGPVCQGCGETEFWVLQIDHVGGGGHAHAKTIGSGDATRGRAKMYSWLRDNGFPSGFRVLCANCNIKAARQVPLPNETSKQER